MISENEAFLSKVADKKPVSDLTLFLHEEQNVPGGEVKELWRDFANKKRERDTIGFYTHIPYCAKKCSYCIYASSDNFGGESEIDSYLDKIKAHYQYFSDVFSDVSFTNLYFGGGTPNILSEKQIGFLFDNLLANYKFDEDGEKTFENNPAFSTLTKLRLLKDYGINRVSFGVQSFDETVLQDNNRHFGNVEKALSEAVMAGFTDINTDLIMGLSGDVAKNIIGGFEKLIRYGATGVHIYPLQMKSDYVSRYFGGDKKRAEEYKMNLINEVIPEITAIADENGFWHRKFPEGFYTSDNEVSFNFEKDEKRDYEKKAYFSSRPGGLNSIFGVGSWSNSNILGRRVNYMIEDGFSIHPESDIFKTTFFNEREWMADYIEGVFFGNRVIMRDDFKAKFGYDIYDYFSEEMKLLEKDGMIKVDGEKIIFNSPSGKERIKYLLSFFDRDKIKKF